MRTCVFAGLLALLLAACAPLVTVEPTPTPAPSLVQTTASGGTAIPVATASDVPATATLSAPLPTAVAEIDELAAIAAAPRPNRNAVELARALGACRAAAAACPTVARSEPLDAAIGELRQFWVADLRTNGHTQITAELRYAGPVALMYVERGLPFDQSELDGAARRFEQEIYPRTRAIFGSEAQPGVDGDNRLTILNARDPSSGVLGYYSSQDSLTAQVNRFSNERDMFFMNGAALAFGSPAYLDVLAHEFQHMIHQNQQPSSAIWFNEGCSQLAEDLNGFVNNGLVQTYLNNPDTQLNSWGDSPGQSASHYGAAHLFMRYLYAQYAGESQLRQLVQADAGDNVAAFVALAAKSRPDIADFAQLVADWATANLLNDPAIGDGRYSYNTGLPELLPAVVTPQELNTGEFVGEVAQFGVDYLALPTGSPSLEFRGATGVGVAAEPPRGRYAWWSGRSDNSVATLTRAFDLRAISAATLQFETWYELETDYDYAFVSVSTDNGTTWQTLPGALTSDTDLQGVNYGNGITGVSGSAGSALRDGIRGRWVSESMDLGAYVGRKILVRFWQINDQGFNGPGMLLDTIHIPELGYSDDVETGTGGWQADGFVRVDGELPQRWELRLVRSAADGTVRVAPLVPAADGRVVASLAPGESGVLVVMGATLYTTERASYRVRVSEATP